MAKDWTVLCRHRHAPGRADELPQGRHITAVCYRCWGTRKHRKGEPNEVFSLNGMKILVPRPDKCGDWTGNLQEKVIKHLPLQKKFIYM